MVTFLLLTLTVSVGRTLVPGSVTVWPLTVTLPTRIRSAASRREQMPPWAMYLLRGRVSPVGAGPEPGLTGAPDAGPLGAPDAEPLPGAPAGATKLLPGDPACWAGISLPRLSVRVGGGVLPGAPAGAGRPKGAAPRAGRPPGAGLPPGVVLPPGPGLPPTAGLSAGNCAPRACRFSSKRRSIASLRSFLTAFFSWRNSSLIALLRFLL